MLHVCGGRPSNSSSPVNVEWIRTSKFLPIMPACDYALRVCDRCSVSLRYLVNAKMACKGDRERGDGYIWCVDAPSGQTSLDNSVGDSTKCADLRSSPVNERAHLLVRNETLAQTGARRALFQRSGASC